jgi:hypothetical protein
MVDPGDALQDPVTSRAERGQIQRDWIAASADSGRRATEALAKAAEMLAGNIPGRRPDAELARAWAEIVTGGPPCHTPRRHAALRLLPSQWIRQA